MKKLTLILLTLLALTLTACGASDSTEAAATTQTDSATPTLTGPTLLVLGTFKLDGTEQAVTPEQAAELLPLWQVYQELSTSDTAAQAEIDELEKQIRKTMTDEQIKAINEMNLTPQDSFAIMQEMGIGMGQRSSSSSAQNNSNFTPGQGMGPGSGAPPDMGGGGVPGQMPGGQSLSQEEIATAQAARAEQGGGNAMLPNLINALIQYLQKLAGS
ncbi:MAG: hypothetical protein C4583_18630 [Anaerolineaceae bacterium]|nr:MAG: hypothetical protein C4583_18630 [Anaerolineaceae bacterium]